MKEELQAAAAKLRGAQRPLGSVGLPSELASDLVAAVRRRAGSAAITPLNSTQPQVVAPRTEVAPAPNATGAAALKAKRSLKIDTDPKPQQSLLSETSLAPTTAITPGSSVGLAYPDIASPRITLPDELPESLRATKRRAGLSSPIPITPNTPSLGFGLVSPARLFSPATLKSPRASTEQKGVQSLYQIILDHKVTRRHYRDLLFFLCFAFLHIWVLVWQRDPFIAFQHEQGLKQALFYDDVRRAKDGLVIRELSGTDQFLGWFNQSILPAFSDPICGDSVCQESPQWGDSGCMSDCGALPSDPAAVVFDMSDVSKSERELFSWNLCYSTSNIDQTCLFAEPKPISAAISVGENRFLSCFGLVSGNFSLTITSQSGWVHGVRSSVFRTNATNLTCAEVSQLSISSFGAPLATYSSCLCDSANGGLASPLCALTVLTPTTCPSSCASKRGNKICDAGCNNAVCGFDGGDCCPVTCDPLNGICDPLCDTPACADPDCTATKCPCSASQLGNGVCEASCATVACNFDGGDCCSASCRALGNNTVCDEACSTRVCGYDFGDCADCALGCRPRSAGNGVCQKQCLSSSCDFDGLDCCPTQEQCLAKIGNGVCDLSCFSAECGFDGGECSCLPRSPPQATIFFTFQYRRNSQNTSTTPVTRFEGRFFGRRHRIIGGVLILQQRQKEAVCRNRFTKNGGVSSVCREKSPSFSPFGSNPIFVPSSPLYNPAVSVQMCEASGSIDSHTVSQYGIPTAFPAIKIPGKSRFDGFPIFFPNSFSQEEANDLAEYMTEGSYVDDNTRFITVRIVTYNGEKDLWANCRIELKVLAGGFVLLRNYIKSVDVSMYSNPKDYFRAFLEILFVLGFLLNLYAEVYELIAYKKVAQTSWLYFLRMWTYIDWLNLALNGAAIVLWITYIVYINVFFQTPLSSYNVYKPNDGCNLLNFAEHGDLRKLYELYGDLQNMGTFWEVYIEIHSLSLILTLLRLLKLLHFQPAMGVLTRTLAAAANELLHFAVLFAIVFLGYAFIGNLAFGENILEFRNFTSSLNTCFLILLGQLDVNNQLGRLPTAFPAIIWFWSFLFFVYFILVNVLLGIIVASYNQIIAENKKKRLRSLPSEVMDLVRHSLAVRRGGKKDKLFVRDRTILSHLRELFPPPDHIDLLRYFGAESNFALDMLGQHLGLHHRTEERVIELGGKQYNHAELLQVFLRVGKDAELPDAYFASVVDNLLDRYGHFRVIATKVSVTSD
eukprot:TRINITY_DN7973_c0_g1_i1.p1 TRINITY_DN7973_c0_g1~~TRINITY_DN7973_c0_g1_i1.p1  ORF type:complete len:1397 (+),score=245.71 TRINITY_DN7973_c0_g1_i1:478-4191(+)